MNPRQLMGIGLAIGAIGATVLNPLSGYSASNYSALAGGENADKSLQVEEFAPKTITVNVGDTITWKVASTEFHTINFPASAGMAGMMMTHEHTPFVIPGEGGLFINPIAAFPMGGKTFDGSEDAGSGLLNKGDSYSLTFTKAGEYEYHCIIHPEMVGTINVRASGQVDTPDQVTQKSNAEMADSIAKRGPALTSAKPTDGSIVAGNGDGHVDFMRFMPGNVTVKAGESLTWLNMDQTGTPHTITFLAGMDAPDVVIPQPQPAGPPLLMLNPMVAFPSGGDTFDGTMMVNSGMIANDPGIPVNSFTLTFTTPGTYDYICVLHEEQGMKGTVTVLP